MLIDANKLQMIQLLNYTSVVLVSLQLQPITLAVIVRNYLESTTKCGDLKKYIYDD